MSRWPGPTPGRTLYFFLAPSSQAASGPPSRLKQRGKGGSDVWGTVVPCKLQCPHPVSTMGQLCESESEDGLAAGALLEDRKPDGPRMED